MYGKAPGQTAKVLPTSSGVTARELREFHQNNPDPVLVTEYARLARLRMPQQCRDLKDEQVIVLYMKEQTADAWRQNMNSAAMLTTMATRYFAGAEHTATNMANVFLGRSDTVANFILKWVPVDTTIESEEMVEIDHAVIIPEEKDEDIEPILKELKVAPSIAAGVKALFVNEITLSSVANLAMKIANEVQTEPEDTSGCGAAFWDDDGGGKSKQSRTHK